ncbi:MAG: PKD domain-containing protein [Actinobacteria bacterium]|nr:PKD domain-containing protein [Actinomycetota bacterium]
MAGSSDSVLSRTLNNQIPVAIIDSITPSQAIKNQNIDLKGHGTDTDGTIIEYLWNFGDGSTSTEQNPTHTYTNLGTYTVFLKVKDNDGAWSDETTTTVTIINQILTAIIDSPSPAFQTQVLQVLNGGTTIAPTVIMSPALPTGKIRGRIINISGIPILGMPVTVNGIRIATNLNGEFEFNFVADGIYTLFYEAPGYISQTQVLVVSNGGITNGPTVIMSPNGSSSVSTKSVKGKKVRKVKVKVRRRR